MGLKVGVVGVGYLGQHHARVLSELPDVEMAGVFDVDTGRAEEVASRIKVRRHTSISSLVKECDAVSVVTPTLFHLPVIEEIFSVGSPHVFLEKPIADTLENGQQILNLAKKHNVLLQIGHIERFNPGLEAILEARPKPAYIEAQRLSPFGLRGTDVPVVVDLMIHDIDIILSLVNSPIATMRVVGTPVITPHIDIANAWIEFENGCLAQVLGSRVSMEKLRKFRVFDREGRYFSLNFDTRELSEAKVTLNPGSLPQIDRGKKVFEAEEPLKKELRSFVEAIRFSKPVKVTGEDGLRALEVALEVNRLAEESLKRFQQIPSA
ncbi:MAG: Gfo/Idh/MocA family oxidoreductase [Nitrospirae bacterium]|jgi:predicted dehydrogenase|nr:Gfo/Idh/MocA family oxidoreductase [Nitrospirota bacterium]